MAAKKKASKKSGSKKAVKPKSKSSSKKISKKNPKGNRKPSKTKPVKQKKLKPAPKKNIKKAAKKSSAKKVSPQKLVSKKPAAKKASAKKGSQKPSVKKPAPKKVAPQPKAAKPARVIEPIKLVEKKIYVEKKKPELPLTQDKIDIVRQAIITVLWRRENVPTDQLKQEASIEISFDAGEDFQRYFDHVIDLLKKYNLIEMVPEKTPPHIRLSHKLDV